MKTSLFDFHLPTQLIAQEPLPERDSSRLLVMHRDTKTWEDKGIRDLPSYLQSGDLLVLNDTRVIPARLRALRDSSGGKVEFLLLPPEPDSWGKLPACPALPVVKRVLTKCGGKLLLGETFTLIGGCNATLTERRGAAGDVVAFHCSAEEFDRYVREQGEVPLPPYIQRPPGPSKPLDRERYQTVFAHTPGAVAAPTAGLHFTPALFAELQARGVKLAYLTLHVGPGTFRPVKADDVAEHFVDPEPYFIPAETVAAVRAAKQAGRRVIAVGTTSLRALEGGLAGQLDAAGALCGQTDLFVYPPREFRIADGMVTNFHIPKSSLLMLVCALASPGNTDGIEFVKRAYAHAVQSEYRFYSYGDACLFVSAVVEEGGQDTCATDCAAAARR